VVAHRTAQKAVRQLDDSTQKQLAKPGDDSLIKEILSVVGRVITSLFQYNFRNKKDSSIF